VECPKFSLLLIPWIMVSGFVYLKTRALRICMQSLQFKVTQRNCHELHGEFCHTNIRYFGCLHPYLLQTVHHRRKITFSVLFLSNIEPVMWYFPSVLGIIPSHCNAYSSWHTCMLQNCCKLTLSAKEKKKKFSEVVICCMTDITQLS